MSSRAHTCGPGVRNTSDRGQFRDLAAARIAGGEASAPDGLRHQLGPRVDAELRKDVDEVRFNGGAGHEQPGCDLRVAEVLAGETGHLQLARRQTSPAGDRAAATATP